MVPSLQSISIKMNGWYIPTIRTPAFDFTVFYSTVPVPEAVSLVRAKLGIAV